MHHCTLMAKLLFYTVYNVDNFNHNKLLDTDFFVTQMQSVFKTKKTELL